MKTLTIVVPCYNEEEALPFFYKEIKKYIDDLPVKVELLFINDGSKDGTLEILRNLSKEKHVNYLSFSRNFGKEAAMYAGLKEATGDYVVFMDADLQDPPKLLKEMVETLEEGTYDSVATRRVTRKGEPPIRSFFSKLFYKLIAKFSNTNIVDGARDYRMMNRSMVDAVLSLTEYNRFSKGIFTWIGFETKWITYENLPRVAGKTKWSFYKLFKYAIEAFTSFSATPLVLSSLFGIIFCFIAFLMILVIIIRTLIFGDPTSGWPSLVCIIFLVSGVQLFCLGIMGQYLSKTYLETKKRPIYIVKERNKK